MQEGQVLKWVRHVMVAHDMTSDRDNLLRDAAAMAVDLNNFDIMFGKKYGEPSDDPVCVRF